MPTRQSAPLHIETSRLILRCWEPDDAEPLVAAITANLDHLRPWMPWAEHEPLTVEQKRERIITWHEKFLRGDQYWYGVFLRGSMELIGGIGLTCDIGSGAATIGYWIDHRHVNKGFATEAAQAMVQLARNPLRIARLEIHCDPLNLPSAAVAHRLGFTQSLLIRQSVRSESTLPRDALIWSKMLV